MIIHINVPTENVELKKLIVLPLLLVHLIDLLNVLMDHANVLEITVNLLLINLFVLPDKCIAPTDNALNH